MVPSDKPLTVTPLGKPDQPLTADDYLAQAESWLLEEGVQLKPNNHETLRTVCRFYAALGERKAELGVSLRSLHRLQEAFRLIVAAEKQDRAIGLRDAIRFTLSRSRREAKHVQDVHQASHRGL